MVIGSVGFAPSAVSLCGSNRWLVDVWAGFFQLTPHEVGRRASGAPAARSVRPLGFSLPTELPVIGPKAYFHLKANRTTVQFDPD